MDVVPSGFHELLAERVDLLRIAKVLQAPECNLRLDRLCFSLVEEDDQAVHDQARRLGVGGVLITARL